MITRGSGMSPVAAQAADPSASGGCIARALQNIVDSYLDAMAKDDASKLPVAASVKFTENGKPLKLGQGFWKTAGISTYRLYAWTPARAKRRRKRWWRRMARWTRFSFD
jgi:hypothetical protein